MAAARQTLKKPALPVVAAEKGHEKGHEKTKPLSCVQRIEAATVKKAHVTMSEAQAKDAEALFANYDDEGTALLTRGALTELLRDIGLEEAIGKDFGATARLAFDAHSADSHFLALNEFKQLYYHFSMRYPGLLPRSAALTITIMGAKGLPPADTNGKSDPYCTCMVVGKPASRSQTRFIEKTLDPWWGEEVDDRYGYQEGDSLLFEVLDYDKGDLKHDVLCRATLPSSEFHRPGGFDGKLPLVDSISKFHSPLLKVRVVVNGLPCPPPALKIVILGAKGLPPADANGKADPFCSCQLAGKPHSRSQTKIKNKTLDPVWNEEFDDKYRYEEGDSIQFEVFDFDKGGKCDYLGGATLENSAFHCQGGFTGSVPLTGCPKEYAPTLQLRVEVREELGRSDAVEP